MKRLILIAGVCLLFSLAYLFAFYIPTTLEKRDSLENKVLCKDLAKKIDIQIEPILGDGSITIYEHKVAFNKERQSCFLYYKSTRKGEILLYSTGEEIIDLLSGERLTRNCFNVELTDCSPDRGFQKTYLEIF